MHPAWSVIFFTTLAGAAQGLVVGLAAFALADAPLSQPLTVASLGTALVLLLAGLGASTFHLGHPERAWRAITMWRTSWLSREVIVLPAFIAVVALWLLLAWTGRSAPWIPVVAIALSALLWLCTAMIYACLRFIQEWAHPLTVVNYTLIGLASGMVLGAAIAVLAGETYVATVFARWGLGFTLLALVTRAAALRRNASLRPRSTLQSATGIRNARVAQTSMGMTGGSYNTREFFHGRSAAAVRQVKTAFLLLGFALPAALLAIALIAEIPALLPLAIVVQYLGLLAERWYFFAEGRHPQNLYYQSMA